MQIEFIGYRVYRKDGIALDFNIDGTRFTRVSMLTGSKQLLWWKRRSDEYLEENECSEIEANVRSFFGDKMKEYEDLSLSLPEQKQLANK